MRPMIEGRSAGASTGLRAFVARVGVFWRFAVFRVFGVVGL